MAKRAVIWTETAAKQRREILITGQSEINYARLSKPSKPNTKFKTMKHLSIITGLLLIFSCSNQDHEEIQRLRTDFEELRKNNESLKEILDSLTINFIQPFQQYQQTVMNERDMSPDSIIQQYESLIETYPNSFWTHEAKKRKNNIENRREYWYEGEWHLEKHIDIISIPPEVGIIYCPGC